MDGHCLPVAYSRYRVQAQGAAVGESEAGEEGERRGGGNDWGIIDKGGLDCLTGDQKSYAIQEGIEAQSC